MKLAALAVAAAVVTAGAIAAEEAAPGRAPAEQALTVDEPIAVLLADRRTAPVLERHLPQFVRRFRESEEFARFFEDSTPRDLTIDPHVKGFTEAALTRLQAELATAQGP